MAMYPSSIQDITTTTSSTGATASKLRKFVALRRWSVNCWNAFISMGIRKKLKNTKRRKTNTPERKVSTLRGIPAVTATARNPAALWNPAQVMNRPAAMEIQALAMVTGENKMLIKRWKYY